MYKFKKNDLIEMSYYNDLEHKELFYTRIIVIDRVTEEKVKYTFVLDTYLDHELWRYKKRYDTEEFTIDYASQEFKRFSFKKLGVKEDFPEYFI